MARAKKKQKGAEAFGPWYKTHWGERWESLAAALQQDRNHVAWWNPHSTLTPAEALPPDAILWDTSEPEALVPAAAQEPSHATAREILQPCWTADAIEPPPLDAQGRPAYYLLDGASVLAAASLAVTPGDAVLDMCAAPGGKSLYLANATGETGTLVANELSRNRLTRLRRVLHSYMPETWCNTQLTIKNHDATRWCLYETEAYDKILLDAPCSSEKHVLQSPKDLATWTPNRSKQLAVRQYALLASALEAVRVGGWIAYCTCSISPLECDQIIAKLHKKRAGRFRLAQPQWTHGEETLYGRWLLPDQGPGWGPIYVALVQRIK